MWTFYTNNQAAISANKYDLGLATNFKHRIHLKDNAPVYRKQLKYQKLIRTLLNNHWMSCSKLGVVK
jgi:hypothetical protein